MCLWVKTNSSISSSRATWRTDLTELLKSVTLPSLTSCSVRNDYLTSAESKRVLSLRNPEQKMSKSAPDVNSRILLTDTPEQIQAKVKKAVTDSHASMSFDPAARPAVSNLLQILAGLDGGVLQRYICSEHMHERQNPAFLAQVLNEHTGGSSAALKKALTESIVEELRPVQKEYERLVSEDGFLDEIERMGREKAQKRAQTTMAQVRTLLGLQR